MNGFLGFVKYIFAAIGGVLGYFFGGLDGFVYTLMFFMALDYVTGVLAAVKNKELSSEIGFWGLVRKLCSLSLVCIAHFVDLYVLGKGEIVRNTVIFFYIANEGISVLENAGRLGVAYPKKLKDILNQLKDDKNA